MLDQIFPGLSLTDHGVTMFLNRHTVDLFAKDMLDSDLCSRVYGAYFAWCLTQRREPLSPYYFDEDMRKRGVGKAYRTTRKTRLDPRTLRPDPAHTPYEDRLEVFFGVRVVDFPPQRRVA